MIVFTLLAFGALIFCVWDVFSIIIAIEQGADTVYLDTATYYLLVVSVFFWFSLVSYVGQKTKMAMLADYAFVVAAVWVVFTLALGYAIPHYLQHELETAGYEASADPDDMHRLFVGESLVYRMNSPLPPLPKGD